MSHIQEFLKEGFLKSVGKEPDYKVILNSMGWLDKGVLTEDDIEEIKAAIDRKNGAIT